MKRMILFYLDLNGLRPPVREEKVFLKAVLVVRRDGFIMTKEKAILVNENERKIRFPSS